ncbi:MAG: SOS response-associated peptidase [Sporichthyaceae bacterium]
MCGRYSASWGVDDLIREFDLRPDDVPAERLEPDYNIAPTKPIYAVLTRRPRGAEPDAQPVRSLRTLRWGLVPFWAKGPSISSRMINARIESAATKPAFREAFARRRCLLPADGYYEWYACGGAKVPKQPFFIRRRDGGMLAMAGLYEFWRAPGRAAEDPGAWLATATILTTTASDAVGAIHNRQPMFVEPAHYSRWLDPDLRETDTLAQLLVVKAGPGLEAYPVGAAVNNHRNNGPDLLTPLPEAIPHALF